MILPPFSIPWRENCPELLFLFLKGMTGALAPLSYLLFKVRLNCDFEVNYGKKVQLNLNNLCSSSPYLGICIALDTNYHSDKMSRRPTYSIMTLNIMTLRIMTLSIMAHSEMTQRNDNQNNETQNDNTQQ